MHFETTVLRTPRSEISVKDEPFNLSLVSAAFVQVKNTKRRNRLILGRQQRSHFSQLKMPVVAVLVDLGVENRPPVISYVADANGPPCWGTHLCGSCENICQVLEEDRVLADACYRLLHDFYLPDPDRLEEQICRLNSRFDHLTLEQRFPGCVENHGMEDGGEQDE